MNSCHSLALHFLSIALVFASVIVVLTTADLSQYLGTRIIGGVRTNSSQFPYFASLMGTGMCGAAILSQRWIITASHCVFNSTTRKLITDQHNLFTVTVGLTDRDHWKQRIKATAEHVYFLQPFPKYDIALLRLEEDIEFGPNVQRLYLPTGEMEKQLIGKDNAVTVAGFGYTSKLGSPVSHHMNAINITIYDPSVCIKVYLKQEEKYHFDLERHICAGTLDGSKDACVGDSGGPLVAYINQKPVILGLVSLGANCAQPSWPGIYTKVSHFLPWIHETIAKEQLKFDSLDVVPSPVNPSLSTASHSTTANLAQYLHPRIIGGRATTAVEYPYNAFLLFNLKEKSQICGGGILSERWIITAGHCFYHENGTTRVDRPYDVFIGVSDYMNGEPGQLMTPQAEYIHPLVNSVFYNDIALIKLKSDIKLGPDAEKLSLPTGEFEKQLTEKKDAVTLAGFGLTKAEGRPSERLQAVNLTLFDASKCSRYKKFKIPFLPETHLCAGTLDGSKDSCVGDSGGSLVGFINKKPVILGITSMGLKCALPGYPGIYTRVSHYIRWIQWIMKNK